MLGEEKAMNYIITEKMWAKNINVSLNLKTGNLYEGQRQNSPSIYWIKEIEINNLMISF